MLGLSFLCFGIFNMLLATAHHDDVEFFLAFAQVIAGVYFFAVIGPKGKPS